ncbi:hypothetical protein E2562_021576 [Oryza meyeriana var. granulata]|uniref:Secreted protein n=1 Tax=Oryza meyeriana var. granulata TaxID=110450 RepID=A0A6G1EXV8_9ORYZ|nr:hypothetical protein E2562_021576 [Oryza meyeriana var. granulata]
MKDHGLQAGFVLVTISAFLPAPSTLLQCTVGGARPPLLPFGAEQLSLSPWPIILKSQQGSRRQQTTGVISLSAVAVSPCNDLPRKIGSKEE